MRIRTSLIAQNSYPLPGKFGLSGLEQVVEVSRGNRSFVIQRGNWGCLDKGLASDHPACHVSDQARSPASQL